MQITLKIAERHGEIIQCQYLIASVYNRYYDIVFSTDISDLNAKIEPYPHYYLMGLIDGRLAACCGLYVEDTYVRKYGMINERDFHPHLREAGVTDDYPIWVLHEFTKLVVAQGWEGHGLGHFMLAAAHNSTFLGANDSRPWLLTCCAKLSIFEEFYKQVGIHTRFLKPFPFYRVHEHYRSESDPMSSRLIIPHLDIPKRWYDLEIPGTYEVERFGVRHDD